MIKMHHHHVPLLFLFLSLVVASTFTADYRYDKHETNYRNLPKLHELPDVSGHLPGSAWLWGENDGLGRLNFLTSERIWQSMKEVEKGDLVPLK
jgi:hypothetical protein